jgi:hypothetical protein
MVFGVYGWMIGFDFGRLYPKKGVTVVTNRTFLDSMRLPALPALRYKNPILRYKTPLRNGF